MDPSGFQELFDEFLLEARERAGEVEGLMLRLATGAATARRAALAQVKRELHTLKGNAGMMGFGDLQALAHRLEDEVEKLDLDNPSIDPILAGIDELRRGLEEVAPAVPEGETATAEAPAAAAPAADAPETPVAAGLLATATGSSVRLPFAKIDELVEVQAETLIFRNRLSDAVRRGLDEVRKPIAEPEVFRRMLTAALEAVEEAREALEKTLNLLQEQVTELGMVPLQSLFHSLGRVVYDESRREGKEIDFEIQGGETPIDKTLLEAASEVLGHLVRNAVIHGIEPPGERRRRGKPAKGKVRVAAALEGGEVRIDVSDDGGGIDYEALRAKAGAADHGDSPQALLFAEGLSTRADAGLGAGRGVGLSAVKRSVEAHSGRIEIVSERGTGTSFMLRLPLTPSILRSLLVTADGEEYALPLASITESQRLEVLERHEVNHAPVVPWRGRLVPLVDLGLAFGTAEQVRQAGYFVIIEVNGRHRGLAIDDIVGIRDIVVKGLDKIVGQPVGISGSTILGDGRVIMILDPHQLAALPPFIGAAARA